MPGLNTYSMPQSEAKLQCRKVPDGFGVLSRALEAAGVVSAAPAAKHGGFDVAARQCWGEEPQFETSNGSSTRSGFDLLDQAQEGVIDGEATEEGLRTASAMLEKRQPGFEVLSKAYKATKAPATSDGFGLIEDIWPRSSPCRPGNSVARMEV